MWRIALGGFLFSCLACTVVWGQSTAQVGGTVRDQSGAVLPGVEVTATQTATSIARSVVTNETGSYVLPNLQVGPYRLEASLPGFRKFVQTGILLQVDASPVINIVMEVGQVAETVEVQADAALVETRNTGIGQVMDNVRVMELPLNARQVTELIIAAGAAVGGGAQNTPRNYPTEIISVAGGSNDGLTFLLDGGVHNDPYGNQALPLPFPDALQEFKVETSAVPAQYGYHAAGAVNVLTKSGSNQFHGSLFEFVRNRIFNARNPFATERDGLKRNQFGGVIGGPIVQNKLFFFAGLQTTLQRSDPKGNTTFIPTPQMLAGDWTTYASAACQSGGGLTLRAPFVNNRIDPASLSKPAVELVRRMNATSIDGCGKVLFGRKTNADEWLPIAKMDYQVSARQSLFGRYQMARLDTPSDYDGQTIISIANPNFYRRMKSFVLGDTYSISPTMVSSFRGEILRTTNVKTFPDFFTWSDLGVKNLYYPANYPKMLLLGSTGSLNLFTAQATPGITNSTLYQFSEDLTNARGAHQIGFGVNLTHQMMNYTSSTNAPGSFSFTGVNTGTGLSDLMTGKANSYTQSRITNEYFRQNYIGLYLQDTWKATSHFTLNGGVRWEPYRSPYDKAGKGAFFDKTRFDQGMVSSIYPNAPAGVYFQGEGGIPDTNAWQANNWKRFAPRLGLAWDPKGDGLTVIRAAYGIFFDFPHMHQYGGKRDTAPKGASIVVNSPSLDDPWASVPSGNPYPIALDKNSPFPLSGVYTVFPFNLKKPYLNQWNVSIQHQFGANWLVSGNYIGSNIIHMLYRYEADPAVFVPGVGDANRNCFLNGVRLPYTVNANDPRCSTIANTNQRRVLYLQNPAIGQYYSSIVMGDDGNTRDYNGLVLSVQRRRAKGITVQGNYTYSHCIDDGYNDVIQTTGGQIQSRRGANRGNCELDRRHNFNMSTVYEMPQFANRTLRIVGSGWQISGIARAVTGGYLSVASGTDIALSGTPSTAGNTGVDQRPNQILPSPYLQNKGANGWLNPAAFALPAPGTYGALGNRNIVGPGSIVFNMGLTRSFAIKEKQSLQLRAEVFNVANHVNYCAAPSQGIVPAIRCPDDNLNSPTFGRILSSADPRIMQMALKYLF
ncbi:MAG TPA: TonB-dependent receptor [Terriglobia bacterium]|nr:TonB-dependent receptor [Terriglobia bacterium]